MTRADDLYMSGFDAALDAAESAGVAILQGRWGNTIRREHAAAGLLHFADAAREAIASNAGSPSGGHAVVVPAPVTVFSRAPKTDRAITRAAGYSGDACDTCGSLSMKRVGSCLTCDACGTTTGCS